jgi:hypothetical protein
MAASGEYLPDDLKLLLQITSGPAVGTEVEILTPYYPQVKPNRDQFRSLFPGALRHHGLGGTWHPATVVQTDEASKDGTFMCALHKRSETTGPQSIVTCFKSTWLDGVRPKPPSDCTALLEKVVIKPRGEEEVR